MKYYLSLGSNVNPEKYFRLTYAFLEKKFGIKKSSSIFETDPYGPSGPDTFWNSAILIESDLTPREVKQALLDFEKECGRTRKNGDRYAARTIDIDLIPQKGFQKLPFIMIPLAELAPTEIDPETKKSFEDLAALLQEKAKNYEKRSPSLI